LDGGPLSTWIRSDGEMDDSSRGMLQNDESVEDPECGWGNGEEVDGSDLGGIILEECAPSHGGFLAAGMVEKDESVIWVEDESPYDSLELLSMKILRT